MTADIIVPLAAGIGSAVAAGMSGFQLARRRLGSPPQTIYVRLGAEDSDRVEKISVLLERLIDLEEQSRSAIDRLGELVIAGRLEQSQRHGELAGRLKALRR